MRRRNLVRAGVVVGVGVLGLGIGEAFTYAQRSGSADDLRTVEACHNGQESLASVACKGTLIYQKDGTADWSTSTDLYRGRIRDVTGGSHVLEDVLFAAVGEAFLGMGLSGRRRIGQDREPPSIVTSAPSVV
jgi:hypothetical protein